jgi:hypothetical protein
MATRRKPVRAGRGRGQDQGRGLIDEHETPTPTPAPTQTSTSALAPTPDSDSRSLTPSSGFGDTDIRMSAEGHPSYEVSGPIYSVARTQGSQGTALTASCKCI